MPLPQLQQRVTDLTSTLEKSEISALEAKLATVQREKGSQIVVLILPTTQPEEIEQFSIRLADAWKIGREKVDDGVIVVVAKDDRKMRIEVGYGLEGAIPDAVAKRIIDEQMKPHFRDGDFYQGISAGADAIIAKINGEPLPEPVSSNTGGQFADSIGRLIFAVFLGSALVGSLGRFIGAGAAAAIAGLPLMFMSAVGLGVVLALIAAALAILFGSGGGGGGWSHHGGVWTGSGFGSGGFGGGGGGFGGGGASGGW